MPEFHLAENINTLAASHPERYQWFQCMKCLEVWPSHVTLPAPLDIVAKEWSGMQCAGCGSKKVTFCNEGHRNKLLGVRADPKLGGLGKWLAHGEQGRSSKTMALVAQGKPPRDSFSNWPHDPDDFKRCIGLLAIAPEVREAFPKIADLSPQWRVIIENWDRLVESFGSEVVDVDKPWSAPKTYKLMQQLFKSVEK